MNLEHYEAICDTASEIQASAPDACIKKTYYCGECFPYKFLYGILSKHDIESPLGK